MFPYQKPTLTIRARVKDLLGRMNTQEKIGQVNQHLYGWQSYERTEDGFGLTADFKQHVAWGAGLGALYGVFRADPWSQKDYQTGVRAWESAKLANLIQRYVIDHSRLGIPTLIVEEAPHGHQALDATVYPTNLAKGNTFDPALIEQSASLQRQELRAKGVNLALVSTLDLMKDPRWGRAEETFGESPTLTNAYTRAVIAGFQGDLIQDDFWDRPVAKDAASHMGVVIKHLIGQGEALGGHNSGTVPMGAREFADVYAPLLDSVRHAIGVMAAYNDIDGVPCHANRELLTAQLRGQHHFQGLIMADGTALDRLTDLYGSVAVAAAKALHAGVDLSLWDDVYTQIEAAIEADDNVLADLDAAVARVLATKFALGLFDHPYVAETTEADFKALAKTARANNLVLAQESVTLVQNRGLLPLTRGAEVAAIGPHVQNIYHWLGDYTGPQLPEHYRTLPQALNDYAGSVTTALGSAVRVVEPDDHLIQEALAAAAKASVIVLTLGGSSARDFDMQFLSNGALESGGVKANTDTGENMDVASLTLGGDQLRLLRALHATGKPIVAVMVQGRPYDIREVMQLADAVLVAWYPGQCGPQAVADLLFGATEPTGRLPISYPQNVGQLPVYYYQRHVAKNDNYFDESGAPLLAFGTGLSYSQAAVTGLTAAYDGSQATVTATVTNPGGEPAIVPVIVFMKQRGTTALPQEKRLAAFTRVKVLAGATTTVALTVTNAELAYTDAHMHPALPTTITFETATAAQQATIKLA
ncbi:glycoside hydrolase family 3 N-terminal domain-containing protein [Lacticaseibacillus parakribbianus]|uniref:glycoside hydrolase family 3 N-terminal domain-containing protein n=1 Tax=Lacticaseibacillus parakribbianus TaxID=2970927 RepID=UPI0021CB3905|nr:glycoside hydrolase family 3 N-terminal domain-containing protein [Lacticaseibacillus parakribbianus]